MKLSLTLILTLGLLLTGCDDESQKIDLSKQNLTQQIQQIQAKLTQQIQEEKTNKTTQQDAEFETIIQSLKKQSHIPNITEEDLEKGWYYAKEDEKKYATPISWVYKKGEGEESGRWIHPDLIEKEVTATEELLCKKTSGTFIRSCNELETGSQCQYVPQSTCQCPEKTLWDPSEGCLKVDSQNAFVAISKKELEQGYYNGLSYERKKGTPESWLWNAEKSIWHSPHLLDFSHI